MALIDQIPSTTAQQASSTGYTPTSATAQQATATGYDPTTTNAVKASSTGYDPSAFQVTPDQTVEGRLSGIIAADSPLMQQARTRAMQYANSRGLINSSMAAGAGESAMIDAAMPIAQQDAGEFNQAMTNTVNAKNTASQFGANSSNTAELTNAQLGTNVNLANQNAQNAAAGFKASAENAASQENAQLGTNVNLSNQNAQNTASQFGANAANAASQTNAQLGTSANLANLDAATKVAMANLDSQTKTDLAAIDGNYKQLLQTNQDAASAYSQTIQNISAISQNSTMSQDAKDRAIADQLGNLNQLLQQQSAVASTPQSAVTGLNLGGYFVPTNLNPDGTFNSGGQTPGTPTPAAPSPGTPSAPSPGGTGGTQGPDLTGMVPSGYDNSYVDPYSGISYIPGLGFTLNGAGQYFSTKDQAYAWVNWPEWQYRATYGY